MNPLMLASRAWASGRLVVLASLVACTGGTEGRSGVPPQVSTRRPPPREQRCTVQVRFGEVRRGLYHAYILTRDEQGATYFRAGPANPGPSTERLLAFLGWRSSPERSWGALWAGHGSYGPRTVDYDTGSPPTMTLLEDGPPCGILNLRLTSAEVSINSARIRYDPLTTNSNAFVRYALGSIQVSPSAPPVPAPGWYTDLAPSRRTAGEGRH